MAVTVARSDYGIMRPVLKAIADAPDLNLRVLVSGAHLSPEFGMTVRGIESDGFPVAERVEMLLSSESPAGISTSMGVGVMGFAQAYARHRPDILLVLGDRFEMFAAVAAALPFTLPVAHIHGGELTEGAFDDALRHAMTKLSHLHFVATHEYGRRVAQLGEEEWRIVVAGAPSLDNLADVPLLSTETLEQRFGLSLPAPPLLVTQHPVTLASDDGEVELRALLTALDRVALPVIFTQPNADPGGRRLGRIVDEFVATHGSAQRVDNLGTQGYFSLMQVSAAMVGNSSSGLIEAPSFGLPVVNIGARQSGRVRGANVIDVAPDAAAIEAGIRVAVAPEFRARLAGCENPYGGGRASSTIVATLRSVALDSTLTTKRFVDLEPRGATHG
jgi:UDP-hydrolysing UDP-N-acetyl-D-glucosamine 2-epimerase